MESLAVCIWVWYYCLIKKYSIEHRYGRLYSPIAGRSGEDEDVLRRIWEGAMRKNAWSHRLCSSAVSDLFMPCFCNKRNYSLKLLSKHVKSRGKRCNKNISECVNTYNMYMINPHVTFPCFLFIHKQVPFSPRAVPEHSIHSTPVSCYFLFYNNYMHYFLFIIEGPLFKCLLFVSHCRQ